MSEGLPPQRHITENDAKERAATPVLQAGKRNGWLRREVTMVCVQARLWEE